MTYSPLLLLAGIATVTLTGLAGAQEVVAPPTPNADALAAQMRILGSNPRDVNALIAAGELSTKLGDADAALVFFQRAQAQAPSDARIPAGKAGALVLLERPGEALRLFDQAERAGLGMTPYLAQRGLAYDLVGQPGLAQRDYRRAQQVDPSDETLRRLALSLGISGQREEATKLLDPLVRRNDRAAWRARAFVLAMGGDLPGAQQIATSMMPGGAGMAPFFARLAALSPADRAFAVHFGEVKPGAVRAADARLAPIPGVAAAPVAVASVPYRMVPARVAVVSTPVPTAPLPSTPAPTPTPAPIYRRAEVVASRPIPAPERSTVIPVATPTPAPVVTPPPAPAPRPVVVQPAPVRVATATPPVRSSVRRSSANEAYLAGIIARITVPEEELASAGAATPPASRASSRSARLAKASPVSGPVETKAKKPDPKKPEAMPPEPKKVTAKKPEPKKPQPRKPDPAKAQPARWWVQVAGGARASDLDKDWSRLSRSHAALKGKGAYVTPLRATNRLLTGPFKSEAEARAVVNSLAKQGTSAFTFQSAAGQKVDRLESQ